MHDRHPPHLDVAGSVSDVASVAAVRLAEALVLLRFNGEPDEVVRAVRRLAPEVVLADPLLRLIAIDAGVVSSPDGWSVVEPLLARARADDLTGRDVVLAVAAAALLDLADRRPGEVGRRVRELVQLAQSDRSRDPDAARAAAVGLSLAGSAALMAGDLDAARSSLGRARFEAARAGAALAPLRRHLAAELALVSALWGDLRAADELLVELLDDAARGVTLTRRTADATQLAQLVLLVDRGAMALAERLVRSRPPTTYGPLWPIALRAHVDQLLLSGRAGHGLRLVDATVRAAGEEPGGQDDLAARMVRVARGELLIASGELRAAAGVLDPGGAGPGGGPAVAALLWVSGEFEAAGYTARAVQTTMPSARDRIRLVGVEAAVSLMSGDTDLADVLVARVARAAQEERWRSCDAHLPATVRSALLADAAGVTPWVPWLPAPALSAPLSPRERVVLRLLVEGVPRAEVAERFGVSLNTVKTQTRRLYAKLGVTSRAQAVARVARLPAGSQLAVRD